MPANTPKGITYPTSGDTPKRADLQTLASTADLAIPTLKAGTSSGLSLNLNANANVTGSITFSSAFPSTPIVVLTARRDGTGLAWLIPRVEAVTSSGFTYRITNTGTATAAGTMFLNYIAMVP